MSTIVEMLTRSHLQTLAVTGGQQPWTSLQEPFKEDFFNSGIEPVFLDRPAFAPSGHHFRYEQDGLGVILSGITFIEGAL